jgi:hypothetical protein
MQLVKVCQLTNRNITIAGSWHVQGVGSAWPLAILTSVSEYQISHLKMVRESTYWRSDVPSIAGALSVLHLTLWTLAIVDASPTETTLAAALTLGASLVTGAAVNTIVVLRIGRTKSRIDQPKVPWRHAAPGDDGETDQKHGSKYASTRHDGLTTPKQPVKPCSPGRQKQGLAIKGVPCPQQPPQCTTKGCF